VGTKQDTSEQNTNGQADPTPAPTPTQPQTEDRYSSPLPTRPERGTKKTDRFSTRQYDPDEDRKLATFARDVESVIEIGNQFPGQIHYTVKVEDKDENLTRDAKQCDWAALVIAIGCHAVKAFGHQAFVDLVAKSEPGKPPAWNEIATQVEVKAKAAIDASNG
jgi:hypothetical protein